MKKLFAVLAFAAIAFAQTPTTVTPVQSIVLPTYIMGGVAYQQIAGWNGFVSGITPVSNQIGMYGSLTADILPIKTVNAAGQSMYLLNTSMRAGLHKVLFNDGVNMILIGGDYGAAYSPAATVSIGPSGSFTVTYVRQINAHWAVGVPIRALWVPATTPSGSGGFNPVAEVGIIWKP